MVVQQHFLRIGHPEDIQTQVAAFENAIGRGKDLVDERAADIAPSEDDHVELLGHAENVVVDDIDRFLQVGFGHYERKMFAVDGVVDQVRHDRVFTQRSIRLVQEIDMPTDDRNDGHLLVHHDVGNILDGDLAGKLLGEHLAGEFGYRCIDDKTDTALGGSLRDDLHADPMGRKCREDPGVDPDPAQESAPFDAHQSHIVDHRDGFQTVSGALFGNGRALAVRMERIEDTDGDLLLDQGKDRLGVQDVRTEIGQLVGLAVRQQGDDLRILDHRRIGRIDPVHIGPVLYLLRTEEAGQQRSRVVAPVASQRGGLVGERGADKSGHHLDLILGSVLEKLLDVALRYIQQHAGRAVLLSSLDQGAAIHKAGFEATFAQQVRHHLAAEDLPEGEKTVLHLLAVFAQQCHPGQNLFHLGMFGLHIHAFRGCLLTLEEIIEGRHVILSGCCFEQHVFQHVGRFAARRADDIDFALARFLADDVQRLIQRGSFSPRKRFTAKFENFHFFLFLFLFVLFHVFLAFFLSPSRKGPEKTKPAFEIFSKCRQVFLR